MALVTPEEAGSGPTALMTPKEARSNPTAPLTPEEAVSSPTAPLTLEEVRMLVELFYLPYHHGALAQELLEHFRWLRANSLSVGVPATAPDACGVRLVLVLLQQGGCHGMCPQVADTRCVPRARGGEAGLSPSSCSARGRAACTAASSAPPAGRCSTTCTPTSGTSATCCWPPVPSSSGWVRG